MKIWPWCIFCSFMFQYNITAWLWRNISFIDLCSCSVYVTFSLPNYVHCILQLPPHRSTVLGWGKARPLLCMSPDLPNQQHTCSQSSPLYQASVECPCCSCALFSFFFLLFRFIFWVTIPTSLDWILDSCPSSYRQLLSYQHVSSSIFHFWLIRHSLWVYILFWKATNKSMFTTVKSSLEDEMWKLSWVVPLYGFGIVLVSFITDVWQTREGAEQ